MSSAKRVAALLIPATLFLGACGEKSVGAGGETIDGWDAVSASGELGSAPEVEWKGQMSEVDETETKVLIKGDGDKIKEGESVNAQIWVGNGYSQKVAFSDHDAGNTEILTADAASLSEVFADILIGSSVGSRVAAIADATDVFGPSGNASMGIATGDPLVIIVDVISRAITEPTDVAAEKLPSVIEKKGKVTGLDFKGLKKPDAETGPFQRTTLKEGDGAVVTAADTVKVNYLGMTFDAKKPFDESYSKEAIEFPLSGVVKGWTYGLTDVKVGSRVVLQIPPALGYGATESGSIPANSTLYFVVDVLEVVTP